MAADQPCPVCGVTLEASSRYPRRLCPSCSERTTDAHGRRVEFANRGLSGGVVGRYADDGASHASQICYVDGRRCFAEETRLGGIIIQLMTGPG